MLKGVERVQLQLEGLTTHFGDEREPYGSRQLAPVGPRACSLHGQIEVLEMAEQEGHPREAPPAHDPLLAVLGETFKTESPLDRFKEGGGFANGASQRGRGTCPPDQDWTSRSVVLARCCGRARPRKRTWADPARWAGPDSPAPSGHGPAVHPPISGSSARRPRCPGHGRGRPE